MGDVSAGGTGSEEELVAALVGAPSMAKAEAPRGAVTDAAPAAAGRPTSAAAWWMIAIIGGVVALAVVALILGSITSSEADRCRGGADKMDAFGADYTSSDGTHWQATYPCVDGGSTTINVKKADVPGVGDAN